MKPLPCFVVFATLNIAFSIAEAASAEPLVTVAPAQVTLHPTGRDDKARRELLILSITNRTGDTWRFSNFYESWHVLIYSGKAGPMMSSIRSVVNHQRITAITCFDMPNLATALP